MSENRPTIYFIRHGETDWNLEGRLQGQRDIPLNDLGRVQAEEAGRRLRSLVPASRTSTMWRARMSRTRETMELLREAIGLHPSAYRLDERLVELTFGAWEGLTWKEVRKQEPVAAAARERDKWGYVPPGGRKLRHAGRARPPHPRRPDARYGDGVPWRRRPRFPRPSACGVSTRHAASIDIWQGKVLVIENRRHRWA